LLPARGRVAEPEASCDPRLAPALLEIGARPLAGRLREHVLVEARGQIHRPDELVTARIAGLATLLGQRDPRRLRERADGLRERQAILAHEEIERVAADPAAKAMEDALAGVDRERRC